MDMDMRRATTSRSFTALALASALTLVGGCTINPATGERQLTLIGEQQEIAMGRQAHQSVVESFGLYPDEELQAYVQRLGRELAAASERPDLPWSFQVVDDPQVNAFALPGGFIYVTRGILAHFNSEAELVSVLGHEIGHVTARHSVEQLSQQQLAGLGLGIAMIASEDLRDYAGLATQGLQLLFLKFSRDDERQADDLGLRYLVRTDYDPHEMPPVFRTLERVSEAQGGGRIPVWASTHPDPGRRAERIAQDIRALPADARQGKVLRNEYLERLEGLVFGSDPRQGYTIGSAYYHPELEFRLQFPDGWQIVNQRQAVFALSPGRDAVVVLTLAGEDSPEAEAESFFRQQGVERGRQWRPGFHYFATVPTSEQPQRLVGLAGFFSHRGTAYRLLGYTAEERWQEHENELERSAASFSPVTDRRYLDVEPRRLELLRLPESMSLQTFARRYPSTVDDTSLAIINGVSGDGPLEAGRLYKRVVGGDIPDS